MDFNLSPTRSRGRTVDELAVWVSPFLSLSLFGYFESEEAVAGEVMNGRSKLGDVLKRLVPTVAGAWQSKAYTAIEDIVCGIYYSPRTLCI